MECKSCELKQRRFYCVNCIRSHLRDFRLQIQHFSIDRDEQVAKASKALETVDSGRALRGTMAVRQSRLEEVQAGLVKLRRDNEKKRDRLRFLRETLATRRRTLSAAKLLPHQGLGLSATISISTPPREYQELSSLSATLARARSGLVQELVEVFNIVEVGGRPPIGGKAGTKGEWTIGDLILPVPGDIRRYPPDHINAVITHTVHFLSLLTFYLGIKLPFEVVWSGKKLGVGQPWIGAGKGAESGGWSKWYTKHPLHLSSSTSAAAPSSAPHSPVELSTSLADSVMEADGPDTHPRASFTTALAMLIYNVCYLAYTQGVDVPLSQAGDVLSNLWSVCCSPELGRRSHETHPLQPAPTPPSFPLEFTQLLQATTANPASRNHRSSRPPRRPSEAARRRQSKIIEEDGWDIIDEDQFS
ncbi:UV radiation resistance protein/autophagy-related protein 14 [Pleurotus pulmonarius]